MRSMRTRRMACWKGSEKRSVRATTSKSNISNNPGLVVNSQCSVVSSLSSVANRQQWLVVSSQQ
jgi:hypothetical protein